MGRWEVGEVGGSRKYRTGVIRSIGREPCCWRENCKTVTGHKVKHLTDDSRTVTIFRCFNRGWAIPWFSFHTLNCYCDFYFRATLGVKEILQSSKFLTSIFWWFFIVHYSNSLKMCFRKKSVCVCVSVCLSVWPLPNVVPKPIDRSRSIQYIGLSSNISSRFF